MSSWLVCQRKQGKVICRACNHHLCKSIPSKAGLVLRVTLLDDLAAPRGHSSVQQALTDALWICGCQLRDMVHSFDSLDLNALTITFKLYITLKNRPWWFILENWSLLELCSVLTYDFNPITYALSFPVFYKECYILPNVEWRPGSDKQNLSLLLRSRSPPVHSLQLCGSRDRC